MDKERADRKALDKERSKLIRTDNEVGDDDEDDEAWTRKAMHLRSVTLGWTSSGCAKPDNLVRHVNVTLPNI